LAAHFCPDRIGFFPAGFILARIQARTGRSVYTRDDLPLHGLLFLYDTLSGDWTVWAFGWLLIPASVGFGIYLGALIGKWGKGSTQTGLWIGVTSLALFSILAAIFGRPFIKYTGSIILIASGVLFVLNSVRKPKELS